MASPTSELVRQQNRAIILATIQEQGPISRVELANMLGLNPATITRIARNLIDEGLIREEGERESKGAGRKPVLLRFNPSARLVIGIIATHRQITGIIANLANQVLNRRTALTYGKLELAHLKNLIEELLEDNPSYRRRLAAICVGDSVGEQVGALVEGLGPEYDMPVLVAETVTLAATGEAELGGMIEQDPFMLFYLGEKSYSCLFSNGHLHLGKLGLAASGYPLADQLNDAGLVRIFRSLSGGLTGLSNAMPLSARLIFEAARQYDPIARQSVASVTDDSGRGHTLRCQRAEHPPRGHRWPLGTFSRSVTPDAARIYAGSRRVRASNQRCPARR